MEINVFEDLFINRRISVNKIYLVVSIFIIIILSIVIFSNNYYEYYEGYATYKENKLVSIISIYKINLIKDNNKISIGGTTFTYKIDRIEDYLEEYKVVYLDVNDYKDIDNDYLNYKIIIGKDTILNYLIKTIKGEWLLNDLTSEKLEKINGGEVTFLGVVGIVTAIVFIVGVIDGFVNPRKCGD